MQAKTLRECRKASRMQQWLSSFQHAFGHPEPSQFAFALTLPTLTASIILQIVNQNLLPLGAAKSSRASSLKVIDRCSLLHINGAAPAGLPASTFEKYACASLDMQSAHVRLCTQLC